MDAEQLSQSVWSSYVHHKDKAWNISTVDRAYDTYAGRSRGLETLVWEWDPETKERGAWIFQGTNLNDHIRVARALAETGTLPVETEDGPPEPRALVLIRYLQEALKRGDTATYIKSFKELSDVTVEIIQQAKQPS